MTLSSDSLLARFDASIVAIDPAAADSAVERAAILEYDAGMPRTAAEAAVCDLYVATTLDYWLAPMLPEIGRTGYAPIVMSGKVEFRRLDAGWYQHLHGLMSKARDAAAGGRIDAATWARLRTTFAEIHRFYVTKYGTP